MEERANDYSALSLLSSGIVKEGREATEVEGWDGNLAPNILPRSSFKALSKTNKKAPAIPPPFTSPPPPPLHQRSQHTRGCRNCEPTPEKSVLQSLGSENYDELHQADDHNNNRLTNDTSNSFKETNSKGVGSNNNTITNHHHTITNHHIHHHTITPHTTDFHITNHQNYNLLPSTSPPVHNASSNIHDCLTTLLHNQPMLLKQVFNQPPQLIQKPINQQSLLQSLNQPPFLLQSSQNFISQSPSSHQQPAQPHQNPPSPQQNSSQPHQSPPHPHQPPSTTTALSSILVVSSSTFSQLLLSNPPTISSILLNPSPNFTITCLHTNHPTTLSTNSPPTSPNLSSHPHSPNQSSSLQNLFNQSTTFVQNPSTKSDTFTHPTSLPPHSTINSLASKPSCTNHYVTDPHYPSTPKPLHHPPNHSLNNPTNYTSKNTHNLEVVSKGEDSFCGGTRESSEAQTNKKGLICRRCLKCRCLQCRKPQHKRQVIDQVTSDNNNNLLIEQTQGNLKDTKTNNNNNSYSNNKNHLNHPTNHPHSNTLLKINQSTNANNMQHNRLLSDYRPEKLSLALDRDMCDVMVRLCDDEQRGFVTQKVLEEDGGEVDCVEDEGVLEVKEEVEVGPGASWIRRLVSALCCCYGNHKKCACLSSHKYDGCQCDEEDDNNEDGNGDGLLRK